MKRLRTLLLALAAVLPGVDLPAQNPSQPGVVVSWGLHVIPRSFYDGKRVTEVAAGVFHSLALKSDGTVVAWGYNAQGQSTVPAGLSGVTQIVAGYYHSLALKSDGTVVAWGSNDFGQSTVPADLSGVTQIAAGYGHSLALKSDGTVVAWGFNYYGESTVPAGLSGVIQIAAGGTHSLGLKSDGTVVAWGANYSGQSTVPADLSGVIKIAAGSSHSLALKSDGTVVAWGSNGYGESTVPAGLSGVIQIAAGGGHSLALKSDGTVVAWGYNAQGQSTVPAGLSAVIQVAGGYGHSLGLKSDGTVVAWGQNYYGQSTVPADLTGLIQIAAGGEYSLGLKSDGTVVAWGYNEFGQSTVPADLGGVIQVAAGFYHSLALKSDGTVVAWGANYFGQSTVPAGLSGVIQIAAGWYHNLALRSDGTVVAWGSESTIPADLGGVIQVAAGSSHSLGLKSDGTVVAWGANYYGDYGQSTVPAGLSGVIQIAAGELHSLALKSDGTVVAWGSNGYGASTVPADLSGVIQIAAGSGHSLALKSDGTVVAWGYNAYGRSTVPAGLSGVIQVAAGGSQSLALLKPLQQVSVSIHSVATAIVSASSDIDDSLRPPADDNLLVLQPTVTGGLVADGVTPLLIKLQSASFPSQPISYQITTTVTGGSLRTGILNGYLRIFQPANSGGGGQFVPGDTLTISPSHPLGFAYISGIKSEAVEFSPGSKELNVTLSAIRDGDAAPTATVQFRIRKPPIVLVHGYNSDKSAWYQPGSLSAPNDFLTALRAVFPADFILPIEYGVDRSGSKPDATENTSGAFEYLAPLLDTQLTTLVERPSSLLHQAWAFTRYDVVGHSQGGVLARMLCTSQDPATDAFKPFRSENNAFRGRFHRVITLNSPHNGSTGVRYLLDLRKAGYSVPEKIEEGAHAKVIQDKFDPFDFQILRIQNHWRADSATKIHLIGTTIHGGLPPTPSNPGPDCYLRTGLSGLAPDGIYSRGQIVVPDGSDGVVDFASQFAGNVMGFQTTAIQDVNISHSEPISFFGVAEGHTVTGNAQVGSLVANLLSGPGSQFGPFVSVAVDQSLKTQIDQTVPPIKFYTINRIYPQKPSDLARKSFSAATFYFQISPPPESQPSGPPSWTAEVFGPDGVKGDGVTVIADNNDPKMVSVSVDDGVQGDVVLSVSYEDITGSLVTAPPVVVVSNPPGANLIGVELIPSTISLTAGSSVASTVWTDYDNGTRSQLYVSQEAGVVYSTDDNSVAAVDATGDIALNAPGSTIIHVSHLGFSAQTSVTVSALPPPPTVVPLGAVSRKTHGSAGDFDIDLPLTGNAGIECRSGGASGDYQIVFVFADAVTHSGASVTSGTGSVSSTTASGNQVFVNLTGVTSGQTIQVTLLSVNDGTSSSDVVIPVGVLVADVNGNGVVSNTDVSAVKAQVSSPVTTSNFRNDVNANGVISNTDVGTTKAQVSSTLTPLP